MARVEMTDEQYHQLDQELRSAHTAIAELRADFNAFRSAASNGKRNWQWWTQIGTSVFLALATVAVIPWSKWVTQSIIDQTAGIRRIEDWRTNRPEFLSPKDGEALRQRIMLDTTKELGVSIGELKSKLDTMRDEIVQLKIAVQSHLNATKP